MLIEKSKEKIPHSVPYHSSSLINAGYVKKAVLLDVDNDSYCDVFVKIYQTPYDPKGYDNCEVSYKIYLKCKAYEEESYLKE